MPEERETTGRCGWAALCLTVVLLFGLLRGSVIGGLAGLEIAELFGLNHAYDLSRRFFVLAGMITGFLVSALIAMAVTITVMNMIARFGLAFRSRRRGSVACPDD